MKKLYYTKLLAVAVSYGSVAYAYADVPVEVQKQGDVAFVTGGIGQEESDALKAVRGQYKLQVMSADKSGHYSGETHIVISDLKHNVLLDTVSGPLLYANLPNGRYRVEGHNAEQSEVHVVTINGNSPSYVRFIWE